MENATYHQVVRFQGEEYLLRDSFLTPLEGYLKLEVPFAYIRGGSLVRFKDIMIIGRLEDIEFTNRVVRVEFPLSQIG